MLHGINDDVLRRALDFFGLRGPVPHDYESTVLPVLQVGNVEQYLICTQIAGVTPIGNNLFSVPRGESWRLISLCGTLSQTGGTVALVAQLNAVWVDVQKMAVYPGFKDTNLGEQLNLGPALNNSCIFSYRFPDRTILSEGCKLIFVLIAGDGTVSTTTPTKLIYERIGERLIEFQ